MTEPTLALSLTVKDAAGALDFYVKALGAVELFRMPMPDGSIAHAEFTVGNAHMYISGESPEWNAMAMPDGMTAPCLFALNVEDCDEAHAQAVAAGAESLMAPDDRFWGMRTAMIRDPYGYRWNLRKKFEDVSSEEFVRRAQELFASKS